MNLTWTLFNLVLFSVSSYGQKIELGQEKYSAFMGIQETDDKGKFSEAPYIITEARLREIRQNLMYPYNDEDDGDIISDYQRDINDSSPQLHKNLYFSLPFFGFRFNYTRVSLNGYLEFTDPPPYYEYPLVFPTKDWHKSNDPSFIGIFYSKCRIGKMRDDDIDRRSAGVYFRLVRDLATRRDQFGVELRERLKWDIREEIIGSETFNPKHAIVVTWKNVSFAGGFATAQSVTNTFQMVIATDETYTYAVYNYLDINWTSHTEAGGDTMKGEGGVPAFVGFNAGNGMRSFEYFPYSQSSTIRDLTIRGYSNGFKGRHIFRIDENVLVGTCNSDIDYANMPISFSPESGNMLGGTIVNISGPCFGPNDVVKCKFGEADEVIGFVIDRNRALCVQPQLFVEGYVKLRIDVGQDRYNWKGLYYVESPSTASQKIFFKDLKYQGKSPSEIGITWDSHNLTANENAAINLSLWGYTESMGEPKLVYINDLASGVINSGFYTIVPSQFRNRINETNADIKFGFLQINSTQLVAYPSKEITRVLWSQPIPLGWYLQHQWENMYGENWTEHLCDDWITSEKSLNNFTQDLPQCPCTLTQALADKGKYMPDFECDKDSNPMCIFNRPAIHCVKTGTPNLDSAEQQCCYDRNGYLMLSQDQQWGSSPRRSHSFGTSPYDETLKISTLSQWFNDMIPKYICCLWQDEDAEGCRTLRYERRPTEDCVKYEGPGIAAVYGDPHIVTFDDLDYTFNGKGEFVLVKLNSTTDNLEVQGRFEQMDDGVYGEVKATRLTSIVAKGMSSTVIEVRRRPLGASWRYKLDVFANAKRIYFDKPSLKVQRFPGVTVYTPTYILNQSEVIIMFDNGSGVEVIDNQAYMTARVYLPKSFMNKTTGLLGNWSNNLLDDFTLPNGSDANISNINDMGLIYNNFGLKWMVNDSLDTYKGRALFYREFGRTSSTYNDKTFKPQLLMLPEDILPQNRTMQVLRAYEICGNEMLECCYDYAMTNNKLLAYSTRKDKEAIYALKETARTKVISCGVLETPRFGRKSTFLFVPGSRVQFECNLGLNFVGDSMRMCQENGTWDTPFYGYSKCQSP